MARGLDGASTPHALLSGGGTGGHVFPGLAVADELVSRGWQVSWAGSERGIEARLVKQRGLPFHDLPARPVVGQGPLGKARAVMTLARVAWSARGLVRRLGARVVVGTGGYVSAPAVLGARLASRPALLIEPNADVGLANRLLSRLAAEAAVAYDETARQLRCVAHTTGVPISAAFFAVGEPPAGPPIHLLALGGSQGSRQLNELLPGALAGLPADAEVRVTHQAGHRNVGATEEAYAAAGLGAHVRVGVVPFLDDVPAALAESHLVISRAGAITLAELCAAGRPSFLVPLAIAGGHQIDNARRLVDAGAAEVFAPGDDENAFRATLAALLADPDRLLAMARAARRLARAGAAAAIADRAEHLGGRA